MVLASASSRAQDGVRTETYAGREVKLFVPDPLPPSGKRALVVVLHGGLGNAERILSGGSEHGLNLNAEARQRGFVVAYLNGTVAAPFVRDDRLAWNAGGCCGKPSRTGVDDVGYIRAVVSQLVRTEGIDPRRVFGIGHSNGAMMTLRMVCETEVYAAAISLSGPLMVDPPRCPAARGRSILAIHGADDANVPLAGGKGTQGLSNVTFSSEEESRATFERSGASYELRVLRGADHSLVNLDRALLAAENRTIAQTAVEFFKLGTDRPAPR